jgi:EpsI family protein
MDSKKTGWISVALLIIALIVIKSGLISKKPEITRMSLNEFPYTVGDYRGVDEGYPDWLEDALKAEEFIIRQYENPKGDRIKLYVAYFTSRKGTSTHNPDVCYPAQGWKIDKKATEVLDVEGKKYTVAERIFSRDREEQVILFWFQAGSRVYSDKLRHQMAVIRDAVLTNQMQASIVRVSCLDNSGVDEALEKEREFTKLVIPLLKDYLP